MSGIGAFLYATFIIIAWLVTLYTLNFFYLSYQSQHNKRHQKAMNKKLKPINDNSLPVITIQLPIYNEKYVAVRLIDAVCKIDYPKEKLQIQILDDSDDQTYAPAYHPRLSSRRVFQPQCSSLTLDMLP